MILRRVLLTLSGFAALLSFPASATPPTVFTVEDTVFGLSESELFVFRTTQDNLGSYFENRAETFLVAIDLWHGRETYWHVDSAQISTVFSDDGKSDSKQIVRGGGAGLVNPFAVLAERRGVLWAATSFAANASPPVTVAIKDDMVTLSVPGHPANRISKEGAENRIRKSLGALQFHIPNYSRLESITTREQFALIGFDPASCIYKNGERGISPFTFQSVQLVRVTCTGEEEIGSVSMLLAAQEQ